MPTYLNLKQRVIADCNRDDLEDDLTSTLEEYITAAIEHFADTPFWFNQINAAVTTTPFNAVAPLPAQVRLIDRVALSDGCELKRFDAGNIVASGDVGRPRHFSFYNGELLLSPAPNDAYTLRIAGIAEAAPLVDDADQNIWTNEAYFLIAAQTRQLLMQDIFFNDDAAARAEIRVEKILIKLRRATKQRLKSPIGTEIASIQAARL